MYVLDMFHKSLFRLEYSLRIAIRPLAAWPRSFYGTYMDIFHVTLESASAHESFLQTTPSPRTLILTLIEVPSGGFYTDKDFLQRLLEFGVH
jgi:hypothetical protein